MRRQRRLIVIENAGHGSTRSKQRVEHVADLEREVALAKGLHKGELAIGFGPYAAELLLPHALPRFVSAHPALRVRIQVDSLEVRSTQPCKAEGAAPPPHCHADISPHRPASGPPTAARH